MSDRQWEKFAELLEMVVNAEGLSWQEKRDKVKSVCDKNLLSEFLGWFPEEEC